MIRLIIVILIIILIKNDIIPVRLWIHKSLVAGMGLLVRCTAKLLSIIDLFR